MRFDGSAAERLPEGFPSPHLFSQGTPETPPKPSLTTTTSMTQDKIFLTRHSRAGGLIGHKKENTLRILACNVNGFSSRDAIGSVLSTIDQCRENSVDFAGFSEANLDFSKPKFRTKLRQAIADSFPNSKLGMSSSSVCAPDVLKIGGTFSVALEAACSRTSKSYADPSGLGRFNTFMLRGNGTRGLAFITAYAACESNSGGAKTFETQQRTILRLKGEDPDQSLRERLWKDLKTEMTKLKNSGYETILLGDFNESLYSDRKGLLVLLRDMDLLDPLKAIDPSAKDIATHNRGKKRIDYILIPRQIENAVTTYGVTDFNEIIDSDHRATFCDIDFAEAFGTPLPPLLEFKGRRVQSRNTSQALRFLEQFDILMNKRKVHQRCQNLLDTVTKNGPTSSASKKMRGIDKDLRDALLCAEKNAGRHTSPLGQRSYTWRSWNADYGGFTATTLTTWQRFILQCGNLQRN